MKYAKIENKKQYHAYCKRHLELGNILAEGKKSKELEDEYYVLDLIIDDYHKNISNNPFDQLTPVDLLKALMKENGYSGYKLAKELGISKSVISDIINYKRGFSKAVIRKIAQKFGVAQESFLKDYELINKESNVA